MNPEVFNEILGKLENIHLTLEGMRKDYQERSDWDNFGKKLFGTPEKFLESLKKKSDEVAKEKEKKQKARTRSAPSKAKKGQK